MARKNVLISITRTVSIDFAGPLTMPDSAAESDETFHAWLKSNRDKWEENVAFNGVTSSDDTIIGFAELDEE